MSVVLGRLKDREWPCPGGDGTLVSFWVSGAAMLLLGPAHLDWWKTCSRRKKNYSPFSDTYWWVWNRDRFFKKHIFIIRKSLFKKKKQLSSHIEKLQSVSSVAQSCPTFCDPMACSTPGLPVHHQLPECAQTHVHQVSDAIQPSHLLLSLFTFSVSQHQGLSKWVSSTHQMAKVLELQLQHQCFQWIFRTDFL